MNTNFEEFLLPFPKALQDLLRSHLVLPFMMPRQRTSFITISWKHCPIHLQWEQGPSLSLTQVTSLAPGQTAVLLQGQVCPLRSAPTHRVQQIPGKPTRLRNLTYVFSQEAKQDSSGPPAQPLPPFSSQILALLLREAHSI